MDDLNTLNDRGLGFTNIDAHGALKRQYESILRHIPARWKEYCTIKSRVALEVVGPPLGAPGRPRKDALAEEAEQLRSEGKSYAQIARALNLKYGQQTTTGEAIRKLLGSRKKRPTPDKT
jgi:hypothetical protein